MPSPVTVECPGCGVRGRFAPERALTAPVRIRCKACGRRFVHDPVAAGTPGSPAPEASPSPEAGVPRLAPGEVLAGRFRIATPLGRGGMGDVYEAQDLELGGRVALKTIRPELGRRPSVLARFKREIQLARQVTHPNVCRVFDVVRHRPGEAGGPDAEVVFLAMELLRGETLARHLEREGRLPTETALPLARQLAEALDAAHRAGVIHRDFKSGNVMLVPTADGGTRAVVTDFGLARPAPEGAATAALTLGKDALGTPDYMAPEQVEGGEITPAVDVYAFGVTLYEMVTGRRPFTGGSALTTAVRRLSEAPAPPRTLVPDLDPRWEAMILRCLARRPEERFGSAGEALESLEDGGAERTRAEPLPGDTGPAPAAGSGRGRAYRAKVAALLLVIAASVSVAVYRYVRWEPADSVVHQVLGLPPDELVLRRSVAVVELRDLTESPETAWLSTALAEMLRTELRSGESLRVVGDDRMAHLEPEVTAGLAAGAGPGSLEPIRRAVGADYVVTGTYATLGETPERRIRLDLHLHDAVRGRTLASIREAGEETDLFDVVARTGGELRRRLEVEEPEGDGGEGRRAGLPATPEAARLYAKGLSHLNRFEPLAARELLARAAEIEPTNPRIHSALSQAWSNLGYEARAQEEARRALEAAEGLPREVRLSLEARLLETGGEWGRAAEAYRSLWALFPDEVEYGVRLVSAQIRAGRAREAMTSVAALRTLPAPAGDDPRIELAEARAARALGELERAREAGARTAERAREQGIVPLVTQGRLAECEALRSLGRGEEAASACREALRLAGERDDRGLEAAALSGLGGVLFDQGDLPGARDHLERALAINREMGNQGGSAAVLNNLAVVLRNQGELARALELYEEVLALARETGSRAGEAYTLGNLASLRIQQGELSRAAGLADEAVDVHRTLGDRSGEASALELLGVVAHLSGDPATARDRLEAALAIHRETGHRRGEAGCLKNLGRLAHDRGDLEGAARRHREALDLARRSGHQDLAAAALHGLGQVLFQRGDLEGAGARFEESLSIRSSVGQRGATAEGRVALARLALEQHDTSRAVSLARMAAREAERQGLPDDRAWALAVLARARAAAGDTGDALETAERAEALAGRTENRRVAVAVAAEAARARTLAGSPEAARGIDPDAAAEWGFVALVLEARLARLEAGAQAPEEARSLVADAERAGFHRIAARCAAFL